MWDRYSASVLLLLLSLFNLWHEGIINCKGTKTFAKEPKLAKLLRELEPTLMLYNKKSPLVFVAMAKLLRFGCFSAK